MVLFEKALQRYFNFELGKIFFKKIFLADLFVDSSQKKQENPSKNPANPLA